VEDYWNSIKDNAGDAATQTENKLSSAANTAENEASKAFTSLKDMFSLIQRD